MGLPNPSPELPVSAGNLVESTCKGDTCHSFRSCTTSSDLQLAARQVPLSKWRPLSKSSVESQLVRVSAHGEKVEAADRDAKGTPFDGATRPNRKGLFPGCVLTQGIARCIKLDTRKVTTRQSAVGFTDAGSAAAIALVV
jgi:hypothetical protein